MRVVSFAVAATMVLAPAVTMAQHATASAPDAYRTQFENDHVRVVRVHYGPNATVPEHAHPDVNTVYVYLNASGPVQFRHIRGASHVANRRPTVAASFRVSRGGGETHEVINQSATPSHFLRIEFKTDPAGTSPFYRETMKTYPAATNTTDVKFESAQMRITRLVVAPGQSLDLSAAARQPALVVALKDGTLAGVQPGAAAAIAAGQERWLDAGQQTRLTNAGSAPAELLRIDFLTGARR